MTTPIVPRKFLWPPYMSADAWQDLADSVDTVFGTEVDAVQDALKWLRETYIGNTNFNPKPGATNTAVATAIKNRTMLDPSFFDNYDDSTERLRLNQLGLRVMDPSVLDSGSIQRLVRHVGAFWYGKGQASFIDFISYCLNTQVSMTNLWTQDYITFLPEGDPGIGTPIWNSGTWYPTTHVNLTSLGTLTGTQLANLVVLFYDVANYNLVLHAVEFNSWNFIVPESLAGVTYPVNGSSTVPVASPIVAMAYFEERIDYISTP